MGVKYVENVALRKRQGLSGGKKPESVEGSVGGRGKEARERRLRDKVKDKAAWSLYVCAYMSLLACVYIKELSVGW